MKKKIRYHYYQKKLYNGEITQLLLDNFKMPILTTMIRKKFFQSLALIKIITL